VAGAGVFDVDERIALLERPRKNVDLSRIEGGKNAQLAFLARAVEPGFGDFQLLLDVGEQGTLELSFFAISSVAFGSGAEAEWLRAAIRNSVMKAKKTAGVNIFVFIADYSFLADLFFGVERYAFSSGES